MVGLRTIYERIQAKEYFKQKAKAIKALCYEWNGSNVKGVPDLIFIYEGRVVFVDFGIYGRVQVKKAIKSHKGDVVVLKNREEINSFIDSLISA